MHSASDRLRKTFLFVGNKKMVLVLNDVTTSTEDRHIYRSFKKKFEKYNYLTIAENMSELDDDGELKYKDTSTSAPSKKFQYFKRKSKTDFSASS